MSESLFYFGIPAPRPFTTDNKIKRTRGKNRKALTLRQNLQLEGWEVYATFSLDKDIYRRWPEDFKQRLKTGYNRDEITNLTRLEYQYYLKWMDDDTTPERALRLMHIRYREGEMYRLSWEAKLVLEMTGKEVEAELAVLSLV